MANEKKGMGGLGGLAQNMVIEVQQYLKGINFPAAKEKLIQKAQENGAPEPIINLLRKIPGRDYESPVDVEHEVGKFE